MRDIRSKPIGLLDSGVGGLTVLQAVHKLLPKEDVIYLGDNSHIPYGEKTKAQVAELTMQNINYLVKADVKAIVLACHTMSTSILKEVKPFQATTVGTIMPTINLLTKLKRERVGIIGTRSTINSEIFVKTYSELGGKAKLFTKACPLFVLLAEEGEIKNNESQDIISRELDYFAKKEVNTLLLGCTHYSFLVKQIKIALPKVEIINPTWAIAEELRQKLTDTHTQNYNGQGRMSFTFTKPTLTARRIINNIFGEEAQGYVFNNC